MKAAFLFSSEAAVVDLALGPWSGPWRPEGGCEKEYAYLVTRIASLLDIAKVGRFTLSVCGKGGRNRSMETMDKASTQREGRNLLRANQAADEGQSARSFGITGMSCAACVDRVE